MSEIVMTGLAADVPIGFLAALGAWRSAERCWPGTRMSWRATARGSYCPVLHLSHEGEAPDLADALAKLVRAWVERPEWGWADHVKSESPARFREAAVVADPKWMACLASELVAREEKLESTPFDMTSGQQKFLADAMKLHRELQQPGKRGADPAASAFREALFGPWQYKDNQHHKGWDPSTTLLGAFTEEAPTNMKKTGVRAAVWLAMEGVPAFPCCCSGGRLGTRGFRRFDRRLHFTWPIWTGAISLRTLGPVLALGDLQVPGERLDREGLRARGVCAVYRSLQFKPNQYLCCFQPAEKLM